MLDIIMRIPFLQVQNKYPAPRFICHNFDKNCILIFKKVQVADEIKRDIWIYLETSDVTDGAWYSEVH